MTKLKRLKIKEWVRLVGKGRIKQLREAAYSKKLNRPLWIASKLNDDQIAELYYRIFERMEPLEDIAKKVKLVWGINPNWTTQQFVRGLTTWKKRLSTTVTAAKEEATTHNDRVAVKKVRDKLHKLNDEVNALGVLGGIIDMQIERVEMFASVEKKTRLHVASLDTMMASLHNMCRSFQEMAIKAGVIEGVPSEINVNYKGRSEIVVSKFVENDGSKMIECANNLIQRMEKHCVSMELNNDGVYTELKERRATAEIDMTDERHLAIIKE